MRARKRKHGKERLEAVSDYFCNSYNAEEGKKVYLEIGCGKGNFIIENAERYPSRSFIALEKVSDVILVAAEKAVERELNNIRFMIGDAKDLVEKVGEHSIDVIYLNFSDPWPKSRHYKRRLTYRTFLEIYKQVLKEDGVICFKTDNTALFEFSKIEFEENGWELSCVTDDLHNSEYNKDNIMTEYEKNFSEKGFSIHRLEARVKK